jgi:hypothetical protein
MTAEVEPRTWLERYWFVDQVTHPLHVTKKKIGQFGQDERRRDKLTRWMKWRMSGISGYKVQAATTTRTGVE